MTYDEGEISAADTGTVEPKNHFQLSGNLQYGNYENVNAREWGAAIPIKFCDGHFSKIGKKWSIAESCVSELSLKYDAKIS